MEAAGIPVAEVITRNQEQMVFAGIESECEDEKPDRRGPVFHVSEISGASTIRGYCPALATAAGVIPSGRFNSMVSVEPAGRIAERCLLSQ